jgi:hypothetical protein
MSTLSNLFAAVRRKVPPALNDWSGLLGTWCDEYLERWPRGALSEVNLTPAVFVFDHAFERVVVAYAVSVLQLMSRDKGRMRGFPDVNVSVRTVLGERAFPADRGHFLGHASGGELDINLFPQRRDLNRGWSDQGRVYRRMERYVADHPGSFFYHRAQYEDDTWIPHSLEYGVLLEDATWWVAVFDNR